MCLCPLFLLSRPARCSFIDIVVCQRALEASHSTLELDSWLIFEQSIFLPSEVHLYSILSSIYIPSSHSLSVYQ